MSYFAKVVNDVVETVIVADKGFIDTLPNSSSWVAVSVDEKSVWYPGVGFVYDKVSKKFTPQKPKAFPSWVYNGTTNRWTPPVAMPIDKTKAYHWDEASKQWKEVIYEQK
jgi:hypothetical protein